MVFDKTRKLLQRKKKPTMKKKNNAQRLAALRKGVSKGSLTATIASRGSRAKAALRKLLLEG